ncbi:hypothetical protein BJX64DRAFT_293256 [Aspergillus heterothallicus]
MPPLAILYHLSRYWHSVRAMWDRIQPGLIGAKITPTDLHKYLDSLPTKGPLSASNTSLRIRNHICLSESAEAELVLARNLGSAIGHIDLRYPNYLRCAPAGEDEDYFPAENEEEEEEEEENQDLLRPTVLAPGGADNPAEEVYGSRFNFPEHAPAEDDQFLRALSLEETISALGACGGDLFYLPAFAGPALYLIQRFCTYEPLAAGFLPSDRSHLVISRRYWSP